MSQIFLTFLRCFGFFGGNQAPFVRVKLSGISSQRREPRLEYEAEEMVRIFAENAVCLRFSEWNRSHDFADPAHVVPLIGIERRKHLIRGDSHRSEELHAISLTLCGEKHHSVVETICALLRR